MSRLWQEALAVGVNVEDAEFCHILRSSFPSSWAILIATLVAVEGPVSLEASLLAFVDLRGTPSKPTAATSSTALSTAKCTNCGRNNHTFEKCFRKGGGAESSAPRWWSTRRQGPPSPGPPQAKVATADPPPLPDHDNAAFAEHHPARSNNPFILSNNPFTSDYHLFVASVGAHMCTDRQVATYAHSGAFHHCFVNRSDFSTYAGISPIVGQGAGRNFTFKIIGVGSVQREVVVDERRRRVVFRNAVHAPDFAANLVSISRSDEDGPSILVENGTMMFLDGSRTVFIRGTSTAGNLHELHLLPCSESDASPVALLSTQSAADAATWHR